MDNTEQALLVPMEETEPELQPGDCRQCGEPTPGGEETGNEICDECLDDARRKDRENRGR